MRDANLGITCGGCLGKIIANVKNGIAQVKLMRNDKINNLRNRSNSKN
jgi:hypothetical protein